MNSTDAFARALLVCRTGFWPLFFLVFPSSDNSLASFSSREVLLVIFLIVFIDSEWLVRYIISIETERMQSISSSELFWITSFDYRFSCGNRIDAEITNVPNIFDNSMAHVLVRAYGEQWLSEGFEIDLVGFPENRELSRAISAMEPAACHIPWQIMETFDLWKPPNYKWFLIFRLTAESKLGSKGDDFTKGFIPHQVITF